METVAPLSRPAPSKVKPVQVSADGKLAKVCVTPHLLYEFPHIQQKPHKEQFSLVKELKLCLNCLQPSHQCKNCPSAVLCHHCKSLHHSLLVFLALSTQEDVSDGSGQSLDVPDSSSSDDTSYTVTVCSAFSRTPSSAVVLLSAAVIDVQDVSGAFQPIRVLIDSGSQANFISENCFPSLEPSCPSSVGRPSLFDSRVNWQCCWVQSVFPTY
ncbi:hypothetical protein PR048_021948 [Dryococelus australis]|uniref:Uncharacterized protein n=1 Tax=Dryococelus australis TaxID=614101 RepID=A0ABQ9GZU8_9NEOP|nr:hypothetical protein PR048_021948 [Dryococelus australis]